MHLPASIPLSPQSLLPAEKDCGSSGNATGRPAAAISRTAKAHSLGSSLYLIAPWATPLIRLRWAKT